MSRAFPLPLRFFTLSLGALAAVAAAAPAIAHDHAPLRGRLVFADHEKPVLRILDLDSGKVTHSFDLPKPNPTLVTAEDGRHVVVGTGDDAGTVRILDSGLVRESHGDHDDVEKVTPKLLDLAVTGDKPAHIVSANGIIALFYDGDRPWLRKSESKAVLIELKTLAAKTPKVTVWKSPAPQHGIAVPLGRRELLLSLPNEAYAKGDDRTASSRPNGFKVVATAGAPEAWKSVATFNDPAKPETQCRLFHGYAATKAAHLFGCAEGDDGGLLILARKGRTWTSRKLAYPDLGRVSALKAAGRFVIGNYGLKTPYDALIRIDPNAAALTDADILKVPGGQGVFQFAVTADGRRLANLTADGKLTVYEIEPAWKAVASFDAVPAFDCAYGAPTPTPNLAVIGALAFVSDPAQGRIREYDLKTLQQGLDIPVEGKPAHIAGGATGG